MQKTPQNDNHQMKEYKLSYYIISKYEKYEILLNLFM